MPRICRAGAPMARPRPLASVIQRHLMESAWPSQSSLTWALPEAVTSTGYPVPLGAVPGSA